MADSLQVTKRSFLKFVGGLVGTAVLGGALALIGNVNLNENQSRAESPRQIQPVSRLETISYSPVQKKVDISFKNPKYARLNKHDELIVKWTDYYNSSINPPTPLPYKTAKAMMCTETGEAQFENNAFAFDPMQIANYGDCGLDIVRDKRDNIPLLRTDFSEFQGIRHTPRVNGKWNYSNSNMTPELSIKGGLAFLFSKAITPGTHNVDESQPLQDYQIKKGDTSLGKIAINLKTTPQSLMAHNPRLNPVKMHVGDKLIYVPAHIETYAAKWKAWRDAVMSYNGGGSDRHGPHFDFWINELEK